MLPGKCCTCHSIIITPEAALGTGTVPIGQPADEVRPPFANGSVLAGSYELDVPSSHAAPVLEVRAVPSWHCQCTMTHTSIVFSSSKMRLTAGFPERLLIGVVFGAQVPP